MENVNDSFCNTLILCYNYAWRTDIKIHKKWNNKFCLSLSWLHSLTCFLSITLFLFKKLLKLWAKIAENEKFVRSPLFRKYWKWRNIGVTEHENDICKSYCDISRLYKKIWESFTYHDINNMIWRGKTIIGNNPSKSKT